MTAQPPDEGPSGWPSKQTIRRVALVWILVAAAAVAFALKFGPHGARAIDVPAPSAPVAPSDAQEHRSARSSVEAAAASAASASASATPASATSSPPPR